MLKKILIFIAWFFIKNISSSQAQSIYTLSIDDINGVTHSLMEYQNHKLMIVVLPATQNPEDTAFLTRIDSIALANAMNLKTIVVPSYEDGFIMDSLNTLNTWYQSILDTSISITTPLFTHASSGPQQHNLFNWLTHSEKNIHYDYEITGPGTIFFINEQGELYGIFGPEVKFSNRVINRVLP